MLNNFEAELEDALANSSSGQWWAALESSEDLCSPTVVRALKQSLDSPNVQIRVISTRFIVRSGQRDLVSDLIASAERFHDRATVQILSAIGELGSENLAAHSFVLKCLHADSKHVRTNAAEAAAKLGIADAEKELLALSEDSSTGVRLSAVEALSALDTPIAISALERVATVSRKRLSAAAAVRRLSSEMPSELRRAALRRIAADARRGIARRARKALEEVGT